MRDVSKYRKNRAEACKIRNSRAIEDAVWIDTDESIIKEGGDQTATSGAQERGPEPVLTAEIKYCG